MLDNAHVEYLELVEQGLVRLWMAPGRKVMKYVYNRFETKETNPEIDQRVAAQVKAMGLTRLTNSRGGFKSTMVELTDRGNKILDDERESWESTK